MGSPTAGTTARGVPASTRVQVLATPGTFEVEKPPIVLSGLGVLRREIGLPCQPPKRNPMAMTFCSAPPAV